MGQNTTYTYLHTTACLLRTFKAPLVYNLHHPVTVPPLVRNWHSLLIKAGNVILSRHSSSPDPSHRIRVVVIDKHPAIGDAIASLFNRSEQYLYCGQASTAAEGYTLIAAEKPHVVILALTLSDAYGLDLTSQLVSQYPGIRILVFSQYEESIFAERAIESGAMGYLMKRSSMQILLEGIRSLMRDETFLSNTMTARLLNKITKGPSAIHAHIMDHLSHRELSVLLMMSEGSSPQEMADRLNLDRKTVETHRRRVKEKLGFESVSALLHFATQWRHAQGNLEPEPFIKGHVSEDAMPVAS